MLAPPAAHLALGLALVLTITLASSGGAAADANACGIAAQAEPADLSRAEAARATRCVVNEVRAAHGLEALSYNSRLARGAQLHTDYMQRHDCFRHRCPGEEAVPERLVRAGYLSTGVCPCLYDENIAVGGARGGSPVRIVDSLLQSPAHRRALLNPDYRDVGVGFLRGTHHGPRSAGGLYTIELGRRSAG